MLTEWITEGIAFITQNNRTGLICQLIIGFMVLPVWLLLTVASEKREERRVARNRRN